MKGLWKNKLGGWNHKDTKRKKQTFNNVLRDKGRAVLNKNRRGDLNRPDVYEYKTVTERTTYWNTYEPRNPVKYGYIDYWDINFNIKKNDFSNRTVTVRAFLWRGKWYDSITNTSVDCDERTVKKVRYIATYPVDWDDELIARRNEPSISEYDEERPFLYGKELSDWKRWTLYGDGKMRTHSKHFANKMDRVRLREWIANEDWDSEIKTHKLSKSVTWMLW